MCFCESVAVCQHMYRIPWSFSPALVMAGLVAAVVQQVLTPEASPSMPSSPTMPVGTGYWFSAITLSLSQRKEASKRESERGSRPSCQLFYYTADRGLPGRQAACHQNCGDCPVFLFLLFICLFLSLCSMCSMYFHMYTHLHVYAT